MTLIELFAIVFPLVLVIVAYTRGVMYEVIQIMAWIGGIALAEALFPTTRPLLTESFGNTMGTDLLAIAVVALPIAIMVSIVGRAITGEIKGSQLSPLNKGFGAVFGFFRGAVMVWLMVGMLSWSFYRGVDEAYAAIDRGASKANVTVSMQDIPVNDILCGRAEEPDPKLVRRLESAEQDMSVIIHNIWSYSRTPEDFKILGTLRAVSVSICGG